MAKPTCQSCKYAVKKPEALVCHGGPPMAVVIDGKAMTMRAAVQPSDPACPIYAKRAA